MTATTLSNSTERKAAMNRLAKANAVRLANSRTIMDIRRQPTKDAGLRAAARIVEDGDMDGHVGALPVYRLAFAPRYTGERAGRRLLAAADIYVDQPLRRLSQRQRDALADAMEEAAAYTVRRRRG